MIVTDSGATAVMASDAAARHGLTLAAPGAAALAALAAEMPGFAVAGNPIDMTSALRTSEDMLDRVLGIVAEDDCADLFLVGFPTSGAGYPTERFARDVAAFARRSGKPVAMMISQPAVAAPFRAAGLPIYRDEDEAVAGLARLASHAALVARPVAAPWPRADVPALPDGTGALSEAQSLAIVVARGIPVVAHRVCRTLAEAQRARTALGATVVLKLCSARVPHKWAAGLVALGIDGADALAAAWCDITARARRLGIEAPAIIVAESLARPHELLVGARLNPKLGTIVVVGAGGVDAEAVDDTAVLAAPFTRDEVIERVRRLRCHRRLVAAGAAIPLARLADVAVAAGRLVADAGGRIAALDLNPVLLAADGTPTAVDALVELSPGPAGEG